MRRSTTRARGLLVVGGLEPFGGVVESGVAELRGEREHAFVAIGMLARKILRAYTCSCRRVSVRNGQALRQTVVPGQGASGRVLQATP